jgi:hypothetical protein
MRGIKGCCSTFRSIIRCCSTFSSIIRCCIRCRISCSKTTSRISRYGCIKRCSSTKACRP